MTMPRWILYGIFLVAISGCGDKGPKLGTVTGTITLEGNPVEGAFVQFLPLFEQGVEVQSEFKTDANGYYEVRYSVERLGAMLGNYRVQISTQDSEKDPETGAIKAVPEKIPKHYVRDSALEFEVQSGPNDATFDLSKKKPK